MPRLVICIKFSCRTVRWLVGKALIPKPEDPVLGTHVEEGENRL